MMIVRMAVANGSEIKTRRFVVICLAVHSLVCFGNSPTRVQFIHSLIHLAEPPIYSLLPHLQIKRPTCASGVYCPHVRGCMAVCPYDVTTDSHTCPAPHAFCTFIRNCGAAGTCLAPESELGPCLFFSLFSIFSFI